jgi:hypothetical protein
VHLSFTLTGTVKHPKCSITFIYLFSAATQARWSNPNGVASEKGRCVCSSSCCFLQGQQIKTVEHFPSCSCCTHGRQLYLQASKRRFCIGELMHGWQRTRPYYLTTKLTQTRGMSQNSSRYFSEIEGGCSFVLCSPHELAKFFVYKINSSYTKCKSCQVRSP